MIHIHYWTKIAGLHFCDTCGAGPREALEHALAKRRFEIPIEILHDNSDEAPGIGDS